MQTRLKWTSYFSRDRQRKRSMATTRMPHVKAYRSRGREYLYYRRGDDFSISLPGPESPNLNGSVAICDGRFFV
jgi:hypothetical protein